MYSSKTLNAIDAQKVGLINEIIDEGVNALDQLIKKIKTDIAIYKLVFGFISYKRSHVIIVKNFTACSLH